MNEFEKQLQRQPLRQIPATWREEILAAAAKAETTPSRQWLTTIHYQLTTLLWPHPKAWGALAAAWVLILGFSLASVDTTPVALAKSEPLRQEMLMALKQQKLLLPELIDLDEPVEADRPKTKPLPRTERRSEQVII